MEQQEVVLDARVPVTRPPRPPPPPPPPARAQEEVLKQEVVVVEQQTLREEQMVVAVITKGLDMVKYEQQPQAIPEATPQKFAPPLPPSDPVKQTKP